MGITAVVSEQFAKRPKGCASISHVGESGGDIGPGRAEQAESGDGKRAFDVRGVATESPVGNAKFPGKEGFIRFCGLGSRRGHF